MKIGTSRNLSLKATAERLSVLANAYYSVKCLSQPLHSLDSFFKYLPFAVAVANPGLLKVMEPPS